jgi:transposase
MRYELNDYEWRVIKPMLPTSRVAYRGWMWLSKRKELSVGKLQLVDGNCGRTVRLLPLSY